MLPAQQRAVALPAVVPAALAAVLAAVPVAELDLIVAQSFAEAP
jgi:hypothetical protein